MFVFYRRCSTVQQTFRRKEIKTKMYFYIYSIACSIWFVQSRKICSWKALLFFVAHFNIFQLCPETWLVGTTSVWIFRCSAIASTKSKREVPDRSERDWPACTFIFSLSGKGWKYIFCTSALMPDLSRGTIFKRPTWDHEGYLKSAPFPKWFVRVVVNQVVQLWGGLIFKHYGTCPVDVLFYKICLLITPSIQKIFKSSLKSIGQGAPH